jgi:hypothetical protein
MPVQFIVIEPLVSLSVYLASDVAASTAVLMFPVDRGGTAH